MEKQNNILEKYIRGSISEEEYNELQQQIQNDSDNSVGDMLNECWQKDRISTLCPGLRKNGPGDWLTKR